MYQYSTDIIIKGKETIYRIGIFRDDKLITETDAFEDYDAFNLASLLIEEFIHYLNKKDIENNIRMSKKIKIKLGEYFNMMKGKQNCIRDN